MHIMNSGQITFSDQYKVQYSTYGILYIKVSCSIVNGRILWERDTSTKHHILRMNIKTEGRK